MALKLISLARKNVKNMYIDYVIISLYCSIFQTVVQEEDTQPLTGL